MIAQLMLEMDNLEQINQNNSRSFQGTAVTKVRKNKIVVLAATNRIDLIAHRYFGLGALKLLFMLVCLAYQTEKIFCICIFLA